MYVLQIRSTTVKTIFRHFHDFNNAIKDQTGDIFLVCQAEHSRFVLITPPVKQANVDKTSLKNVCLPWKNYHIIRSTDKKKQPVYETLSSL